MSDFFDASGNRISDGLTARASDVNTLRDEVGAGFDLLPDVARLNAGTVNFAVDTGTANTYLVSLSQTPASYTDGLLVTMRPLNSNTGASTINVDSLGVKSIRGTDGLALSASDIVVGVPVDLRYSTATGFFHLAPNSAVDATAAAASAVATAASAAAALVSQNAAAASAIAAQTAETNAELAETNAETAETNAAASALAAQTAETNAELAETNAETALTDALAIYGSIAAVQAAAAAAQLAETNAETAETNAETAETNAELAEVNAEAAAAAALVSENAAEAAYNGAIAIYGSIAAVNTAVTNAQTAETNAETAETNAEAAAASAAASATSAASVVSQDLSAIDRTVFAATIVDAFLYDTEKDSDGGAWRKRCAHTSWENETLSGNWLGSAANEAAARAISGATTGSYYYDTTALGFYTLNAGSGKTATYRGNVRQFPAKVLITVETTRVIIWDLTQAAAPMWMAFDGTYSSLPHILVTPAAGPCTAVVMLNGKLCASSSLYGLSEIDFSGDFGFRTNATERYKFNGRISSRNSELGHASYSSAVLVSGVCNDVAMTVLHNAPVDVATSLPVPTIAVATGGNTTYSTSVIKDDGTVVNIASDSTGTAVGVEFDGLALKVIRSDGTVYYWNDVRALTTGMAVSATVSASTTPAALGTASKQARRALSSSTGVTLMRRNQLTLASSMLAYVTKDYTSGWMVGDIRGAWLADTVAETLTGTELVTNGGLTVNATGWTTLNGAGLAHGANGVTITNAGATYGGIYQALTGLTVGKKYTVTMKVTGCYGVPARWGVPDSVPTTASGIGETTVDATLIHTFEATATTHYLVVGNRNDSGGYNTFGSISLRRADVDRSVKAKGLQIFGSLTKSAVASGAALMGYSGFSAANYAEQPYNSDLDFGTGNFFIMGWLYEAPNSAVELVAGRAYYNGSAWAGGGEIILQVDAAGTLRAYISDDSFSTSDTIVSTAAVDDSTWRFAAFIRRGSSLELWVNGAKAAADTTIVQAAATLNNASATLMFGRYQVSGVPLPMTNGKLALWRAGATAPTEEQIKHIYQTEKPMFEANAQCCLAGTSNAVTALAYDDETDLLHVGTSYGRSAFKGLVRVSSEATPVGAITALAASAGVVVQGGATAVDVYVPAYTLREELLRDAEQMARFGQNLIAHDFTATASQEVFTLPVGWEIVAVYQQGLLKRETTAWVRTFDGFKWSVDLVTGATVSDWISILAKRV
jgi:hypothetical protein